MKRMDKQHNSTKLGDGPFWQPLLPVEAYNQGRAENQLDNALRIHIKPHDLRITIGKTLT